MIWRERAFARRDGYLPHQATIQFGKSDDLARALVRERTAILCDIRSFGAGRGCFGRKRADEEYAALLVCGNSFRAI